MLQSYFRSGWAFLIPYLAAYLLYAWLRWPVHVAAAGSKEQGAGSWLPCLLHVYWTLHAIHLVLGGIALRTWWRDYSGNQIAASSLASPVSRAAYAALPWLCLALIFWIPGIYLEWPADPWEHLRRINEWQWRDLVGAHSAWRKSGYFFAYSLTGPIPDFQQLSRLNLYYTGACLLLSWQYYRLAHAIGLNARFSFLFVLLNAITFGNNIFSFYRYYGTSSSIFAQIGAVALARVILAGLTRSSNDLNPRSGQPFAPVLAGWSTSLVGPGFPLLISCGLLFTLVAFNHVQGLGIAGLGILAVIVWRLIAWLRSMAGWLVLAAVILSVATVWWYPRNPVLDAIYRPQGWLTAWYGFDLLSGSSPAAERAQQIFGTFGLLNLLLGLWLVVRYNHVAGWLSVLPGLALSLPCFAIPLAHVLANSAADNEIITFHRLLFAAPSGLALIAAFASAEQRSGAPAAPAAPWKGTGTEVTPISALAPKLIGILLAVLVLLPSSGPYYNRVFHATVVTPDDLKMSGSRQALNSLDLAVTDASPLSVVMSGFTYRIHPSFSLNQHGVELTGYALSEPNPLLAALDFIQNRPPAIFIPSVPTTVFTAYSVPGFLSHHWRPQLAAYQQMGNHEAARQAEELGCVRVTTGSLVWYRFRFQPAANE